MAQSDSLDKIIPTYFAAVAKKDFTFKNRTYFAKPLHVSPQFFNEYKCNLKCSGCCPRFTLDYLETDSKPDYEHIERSFKINDSSIKLFSKIQKPTPENHFCDNVDLITGECKIHGNQPFSCDFETLRFTHFSDHAWLGIRPYGRGWNMLRIDGERGAMCEFPKVSTEEARLEGIRKLKRLKEWTDAAGLETWIPEIIEWASVIQTQPLILVP